MPPRKRTRAAAAPKTPSGGTPRKRTKKTDTTNLPGKPSVDTYKPAADQESKEQLEERVVKLIDATAKKLTLHDELGQHQVRVSISSTEGDLLLSGDEKNLLSKIQTFSGGILVVSDKIVGSAEREVVITGEIRSVILAITHMSYFLANVLELGTTETIYHTTLLISSNTILLIGLDNLTQISPDIDISRVKVPFSSFHTVYIKGKIPLLMSSLSRLLIKISKVSLKERLYNDHIPEPFPIIRTKHEGDSFVRSSSNHELLQRSKQAFYKYLSQDHGDSGLQEDVAEASARSLLERTKKQLDGARQECEQQSRTVATIKQQIEIPLELLDEVTAKIGEIRSKSNSNVIVEERDSGNAPYRILTFTGLPQANGRALRMLRGVLGM